ncbi:MAG: hypothetical protein H8E25_13740 [Planctomycetes bacterium]|nr:hypothetical protein [Planctomycetota bacterium]
MRSAIIIILSLAFASCQSTTRDIISTGHPLGDLTPVNDHLVDIKFGSKRVSGNSEGTVILKIFTMGPEHYSEGLAAQSSGDGFFAATFGAIGAMMPSSGMDKMKSAAVRDACDKAQCDLIGYPMFYIDEKDYFLWTEVAVKVVGFPGMIESMSNIVRKAE